MFNIARSRDALSWLLLALPLGAASCTGADPAESDPAADQALAPAAPIPIHHVIVIIKENHTFDNYFGAFPGAEGTLTADGRNLCASPSGPAPCGHAPDKTSHDLCHGHDCGLIDWNGGAMNGWSQTGGSDTGDNLAYQQYGES